jgi:hypothetical protein
MCPAAEAAKESSMKLKELKAGDLVFADGSFSCVRAGQQEVKADERGELYIGCSLGRHYLQTQTDEDGELVGLSAAP